MSAENTAVNPSGRGALQTAISLVQSALVLKDELVKALKSFEAPLQKYDSSSNNQDLAEIA